MLVHGPLSQALKAPRSESGSQMALTVTVLAGAIATTAVFALWTTVSNDRRSRSHSRCRLTNQDMIPPPIPQFTASGGHLLSIGTALVAYWLPLPIPSPIASKSSFRFRSTRDHVTLLASIFAFQTFAFRPQPTQLDALVIAPLALITFAMYEPPLPALKSDAPSVSLRLWRR